MSHFQGFVVDDFAGWTLQGNGFLIPDGSDLMPFFPPLSGLDENGFVPRRLQEREVLTQPIMPVPCVGCARKRMNPDAYVGITPGRTLHLPCGHSQCRSCLTEYHHAKGEVFFHAEITCIACDMVSFPSYRATPLSPQYLTDIGNADILNINSPDYAAGNHFIFDGAEARIICAAVTRLHEQAAPGDFTTGLGLTNELIFNTLSAHIHNIGPYRLFTPILFATELQDVVLGDLVYHHLVRRPDAPHRMLAPYFDMDPNEDNWRRQALLVKVLRAKHPDLEALMASWESLVANWVTVLARRWWSRFEREGVGEVWVKDEEG